MTYYIKGGSNYNAANPKVWTALFLGGFPDADYPDPDWKDIDYGSHITTKDPYWRFGSSSGGAQTAEFGLYNDYRIEIDQANGVRAWDGSGWIDLLVGGGGGGNLDDLDDVVITGTPADNELLAWNNGTSNWINQTAGEAGLSLSGHGHGQLHDQNHDNTDHTTNYHTETAGSGVATVHSDINSVGSGDIITSGERSNLHEIYNLEVHDNDEHDPDYKVDFTENTAFNKDFGTLGTEVCVGNDSRLSDARTPTAHILATSGPHSGSLPLTDLADYTTGRIIYGGAIDWQFLTLGTENYVLKAGVTYPAWGQVDWGELSGKPGTFPPSSHALDSHSVPTGSIAMSSQKFTGLDAGSGAGDSVRYEQLHAESHDLASHSTKAHSELTDYNAETDVKHLTDAQQSALHSDVIVSVANVEAVSINNVSEDISPTLGGDLACADKALTNIKSIAFNDGDQTIIRVDDDVNLVGDSDTYIATQKAIKAYVDASTIATLTLQQCFDNGKVIDGANSEVNAVQIGDGTDKLLFYSIAGFPNIRAIGAQGFRFSSDDANYVYFNAQESDTKYIQFGFDKTPEYGYIFSTHAIRIAPSSDYDNVLELYTLDDIPRIKIIGGEELYIESDGGLTSLRLYDGTEYLRFWVRDSSNYGRIDCSGEIHIRPNGITADYFKIESIGGHMYLRSIGGGHLVLDTDGGNISIGATLQLNTNIITSTIGDYIYQFGRSQVGASMTSASFGYRGHVAASHALRQTGSFATSINAIAGQVLTLRNNNVTKMSLSGTELTMGVPILMDGNHLKELSILYADGAINFFAFNDNANYFRIGNAAGVPVLDVVGNNGKIQDIADPVNPQDVATKAYSDLKSLATHRHNNQILNHNEVQCNETFWIKPSGDYNDYFAFWIEGNAPYISMPGADFVNFRVSSTGAWIDLYADLKDQASAISVNTFDKIKAVQTLPDGKVDYNTMPSEIEITEVITENDDKTPNISNFTDVGDMMYYNFSAIKEIIEYIESLENRIVELEK